MAKDFIKKPNPGGIGNAASGECRICRSFYVPSGEGLASRRISEPSEEGQSCRRIDDPSRADRSGKKDKGVRDAPNFAARGGLRRRPPAIGGGEVRENWADE